MGERGTSQDHPPTLTASSPKFPIPALASVGEGGWGGGGSLGSRESALGDRFVTHMDTLLISKTRLLLFIFNCTASSKSADTCHMVSVNAG